MTSQPSLAVDKIDVHHHFYPPELYKAIEAAGGDPSGWYLPPWTLELDDAICTDLGVTTAILSVTAPGACILKEPEAAAKLARHCNEYAAGVRDSAPTKYGFFASVPSLFDVELVLAEIKYAFDVLNANGVILFTRYGDGPNYLGHSAFEPVWQELSKRQAVVLVHPTHPHDTSLVNKYLPQPMFDYPHETGRAAMDLITTGRLRRNPGCRVILSHAGGTLPYLIHRAASMLPHMPDGLSRSRDDILEEARGFYFDTAISSNPVTLKALVQFAKPGHILFGSDFPNAPRQAILDFTSFLDGYAEMGAHAAWRQNALKLFPALA